MRALVYAGPEHLELRDVPAPQAGADDVAIEVESVGICGSDMHAYLGHDERRPAPLILGHEVAGLVVVPGLGDHRVAVNPLVTCGRCPQCLSGRDNLCPERQIISMPPREGGFAEAITIPRRNIVDVPDHITADQAALTEPIACGWHASKIAVAHAGASGVSAVVLGGGAIGLGAALSLRAQGVSELIMVEPSELRRAYLRDRCGEKVVAPDRLISEFFDIVIDGVGLVATREQASAVVRPGGIIVHIGLGSAEGGLDVRRMTLQEITFVGTYTYTAKDFRETAQAMSDGRLGALDWTEARGLSDGAAAFEDIRAGRNAAPKIILKPNM
ncbi:MAG: alcohol dehydrogenase catalytic domain-containing protein [Pseudomonadota bacterium]